MPNKVLALLPNAGLANKLLVWAHAYVFASCIEAELYTHGWFSMSLGPWIRRERSKRLYFLDLKSRTDWLTWIAVKLNVRNNLIVTQAQWDSIATYRQYENQVFSFNSFGDGHDLFARLRPHRDRLRLEFNKLLRAKCRKRVDMLPDIEVALHIRRGDFVQAGWQMTTEEYFVEAIDVIRSKLGTACRCVIFTDANQSSLELIARVPNVTFHTPVSDVVDMVQMSRAKVIATSLGSTYGYFAAFLSDSHIISHPNHWQGRIGDETRFEGVISDFGEIPPLSTH